LPHVVLEWEGNISEIAAVFHPIQEENSGWRIKIEECYFELRGYRAIVPVTVVEEGHVQSFYIRLSRKDSEPRMSVRLDPATDPVKTRGVKRSIGLLVDHLCRWFPSISVTKHNVEGYIQNG